jgi:hypothetical protein
MITINFNIFTFSDLPLETWTDLFGFLPRTQLVALLPRIDDRKFASFLQFFLVKCGKVTLDNLTIKSYGDGPGFVRKFGYGRKFPLADVSMPENIKNFQTIHLKCVFLRVKNIYKIIYIYFYSQLF